MAAKPLNDLLNWRYATKKMDTSKAVPQDKVDAIVEAIRMAPTSSGTQPFELFVVTNADIRDQITEAAGGQAQITDGSHLLVFAASRGGPRGGERSPSPPPAVGHNRKGDRRHRR